MRLPVMQQRLSDAAQRAGARLDGMEKMLPEPKPRPDFATYVQQARQAAQRDPAFRAQFEQSLRQYQAVQGVNNG